MTIYDIAQIAGVSASTVSRVMNDKPGVGEATRKKIKEIMQKHHFQPSEAAQDLATNSTRVVACFMATIRQSHHADRYTTINKILTEEGFSCIVCWTGYSAKAQADAIVEIQTRKNLAGIILFGDSYQNDEVERAIRENVPELPIVMLNGDIPLPNVINIVCEEDRGVAELVKLLVRKGHRRLAFVNDRNSVGRVKMVHSFETTCRELNLPGDPLVWMIGEHEYNAIKESVLELIHTHPEVDGILFAEDLMASVGGRAIYELGIKVPEQIAYTGNHNVDYSVISTPQITTLEGDVPRQCKLACSHLIAEINGVQPPEEPIRVPTSVVERETT